MPQTLSKYILAIIRDSGTYTADSLQIDGTLCQRFHGLMTASDHDVRERGFNLEWTAPGRLTPASTTYQGGYDGGSVDLQSALASQSFRYIGDFHTHPYEKKYGAQYAIGPSNGDWMQWFMTPPQQKPVAVHCVASGSELFVLVFRNRPNGQPDFQNVTTDAGRLNTVVRDLAQDDIDFADRIGTASTLARNAGQSNNHGGIVQAWTRYRQAITQNLPGVPAMHQTDAHAMNRELCNRYGYEYFRGPLRSGSSLVTLQSNRAKGNWFTSSLWSSENSNWF